MSISRTIRNLQKNSIKQRSDHWYKKRSKMITASDCGIVLGYNTLSDCSSLIHSKLSNESFENIYTRHGTYYEPYAIKIFEQKYKKKVYDVGLLTHKKHKFLGASPDGIVNDHFLIEIKCPYKRKITGTIFMNYYAQVQLQLEVSGLEYCYFYECKFKEVDNKKLCKDYEFTGYNETTNKHWFLENDNMMIIERNRDWFKNNFKKLKEFHNVLKKQKVGSKNKKRKRINYRNLAPNKRTKHSKLPWINESKMRNYIYGNTLCDWLDLHGSKHNFKKQPFNQFTLLKFEKALNFRHKIFNMIQHHFTDNKSKRLPFFNGFSYDLFELTQKYMKAGVPIIIQGVIANMKEHIYSVPNLLVRSDYVNKLFNEQKTNYNFKGGSTYSKKWFYIIISVKYQILNFKSNKETLCDNNTLKMYNIQSVFQNRILSQLQKKETPVVLLVGKGWKYMKKKKSFKKLNDYSKMGLLKFDNKEAIFKEKVQRGLKWYRDVEANGHKWKLYPKPSRQELYPLINSNNGDVWGDVKAKIAHKLKDISQLWQVGPTVRYNTHKKGIFSWDDPKFTPENIGFKKDSKRNIILSKILEINRSNKYNILPQKIQNNLNNWKDSNKVEFYIDFETLNNLYGGRSIIYLIGLLVYIPQKYNKKNRYRFYSFYTNTLTKNEELKIIEEWIQQMNSIRLKYGLKKNDINCYCWSQAENTFLRAARKRHNKENDKKWKINFTDVIEIFKQEPIVIKDCLSGFGLKAVSKAMYKHGMIPIKYDTKCTSGAVSMASAIKHYEKNDLEAMQDIMRYNQLDCQTIYEIISYLRIHHT